MNHRVIFFGSGSFGLLSFNSIRNDPTVEIVAIVTQPPRRVGRQQVITPTPVQVWASAHNLPILTPLRLKNSAEIMSSLETYAADTYVVADYGLIIPPQILALPKNGCINIHASLLPQYRGASPIAQSILNGDRQTGVTLMVMDAGMDTGPILAEFAIALHGDETQTSLRERLSQLAADHTLQILKKWWQKEITPQPQPSSGISLAPKIRVEDGLANWSSGQKIERMLRALSPWPGVWAHWRKQRIKFLSAQFEPGQPSDRPGTIVTRGSGWAVACSDGWLIPTQVHFESRQPQAATNIPGSYPGFIGSQFDA